MTTQAPLPGPPATVTAWTAAGDPREDGAHTTIGYVRAGSILVYVFESTVTPGVIVFDIDSGGEGDDLPAVKVVINDDQVWPVPAGPENGCDDCTEEAPCIEHLNDEQDDDEGAVAQVVAVYPDEVVVKRTDLSCAIADLTAAGKEGHALYRLRDAHRAARAAATS